MLDIGYAIIALILADILINLIVLIIGSVNDLKAFCSKVKHRCKRKRRYEVGAGDSSQLDKSDMMRRKLAIISGGSLSPTDISTDNQFPAYVFEESRTKISKSN